jgi:hypothetical protein
MSAKGVFVNMSKAELNERIDYDEERDYYWDRMPTGAKLDNVPAAPVPYTDEKENNMHETIMTDDSALAALIAEALMNDPDTEDAVIEVINERGMITLKGQVDDPDTKQTAEEIAAEYPGVVSVTNALVVNHH